MAEVTFAKLYKNVVEAFKGDIFIEYFENGRKVQWSKEKFMQITDSLSAYFAERLKNVKKGTWVGICCDNSPYWVSIFFALEKCGYCVAMLNCSFTAEQVNSFSKNLGIEAVIEDNYERAEKLDVKELIMTDDLKKVPVNSEYNTSDECWETKTAFVTSGTTSNSKLYVFSAESIAEQIYYITAQKSAYDKMYGDKIHRFLQILPLRHCLGFGTAMALWIFGYTAFFPDNIGILTIIDTIRKADINYMVGVPAIWKAIFSVVRIKTKSKVITEQSFRAVMGDSLLSGICSGAKAEETLIRDFRNLSLEIINGWGMTEIGIAMVGFFSDNTSYNYTGKILKGSDYKVAFEDENGNISESGTGELLINGNCLYSAVLTEEGLIPRKDEWFHTGDIFENIDTDYYFKGRCKSVIITDSGENLYPEELEESFCEILSDVPQFCIACYQNCPVLFIYAPEAEKTVLEEKIRCQNQELMPDKRIAGVFISENPLPVTTKGESSRFKLAEFFESNKKYFNTIILQKGKLNL